MKKPPGREDRGFLREKPYTSSAAAVRQWGALGANFSCHAVHFLQPGGLAAQSADVKQLGAANLVAADLLDLVNHLGIEREDALHALAKAHFAHGKRALRPAVNGDDQTLKGLKPFLIAFLDLDLDANLVARDELREICALQLIGQALHYGMNRHGCFLLLDSEFPVYQRSGFDA